MKRSLLTNLVLVALLAGAFNLGAQKAPQVKEEVMKDAPFLKINYTGTEVLDIEESKLQTRYPGFAIGRTFYDLQTNGSNQNRITVHGSNEVSAVWTMSLDEFNASFPNRGTGYNTYDGGAWGPQPANRLETRRIGWPGINVADDGTAIVVSHVSDPVFNNEVWITSKSQGGAWTEAAIDSDVPDLVGHLWPRSIISEDGKLHVFALTTPVANNGGIYEGVDGHLLYFRSADNGQFWEVKDMILPGLDSSNYTSMSADAYALDANAGVIAFAHFDDWNDITLYKSTDGGDNWQRIIVNDFPLEKYEIDEGYTIDDIGGVDTLGPGGSPNADSTALKAIYTSDNAGSVVVDNTGKVHVWFGEMYVADGNTTDGVSSFYPATNGLAYWNEDMVGERPVTITGALDIDGNGVLDISSIDNIATYFFSLSSMPNAAVDENDHLYLTYAAVMENYTSVDLQHYRHVYLMKSEDGGETWTEPFDVINEDLFGDPSLFAFVEAVFPTISVDNQHLHLIFQQDFEPGLAVRGDEDPVFENEIVYLRFDKNNLTLVENVVSPETLDMSVAPNPAADVSRLSYTLDQEAAVQVEILNLEGKTLYSRDLGTRASGSYTDELNIDHLQTGIYMCKLRTGKNAATVKLVIE
ncbi:MAG: T9SS type A sorting domain-containing protein [Saprospiraceae bacterium]|nr:T9SS type A sorting domain-containing protein [Saprospiraceae bacterium]